MCIVASYVEVDQHVTWLRRDLLPPTAGPGGSKLSGMITVAVTNRTKYDVKERTTLDTKIVVGTGHTIDMLFRRRGVSRALPKQHLMG